MIRSHPAALEQCRRLLSGLPDAAVVAAATTADAARIVSEEGDPTQAAITSMRAVELFGLHVLEHDVGDHPEAFTRFFAIATHLRLEHEHGVPYRTSFSFVTDHRPGSLHSALEPFARLESRPSPARLAADPAHALALPLRRGARWASARRPSSSGARRSRDRTRHLLVSGIYPE